MDSGYLADFTKQGDGGTNATFAQDGNVPGKLSRVGGSFPGYDTPIMEGNVPDSGSAEQFWGLPGQSDKLGGGLV